MAGKYDDVIKELRAQDKGGRLIAAELGLNPGYVSKRLKAMGLNSSNRKNQHKPSEAVLDVEFAISDNRTDMAAENFLKFLCDSAGFDYADPPPYQPYDLLVDFGSGWKRVQVKTTRQESFSLTRSTNIMVGDERKFRHSRYDDGEIDYFFLFRPTGKCWLVPFTQVKGKATVRPHTILPGFEIKSYFEK